MHAALHHTANARNEVDRRRYADDASRRADHVHYVVSATPGSDGIPMRVERADGNGNAGLESQFLRPVGRERSCNLVGGGAFALKLFTNSGQQGIDLHQKALAR